MQRTKPPFRADMVGSLLRTGPLKEARDKHHRGEISDAELKAVEDREIRAVIKKQEEIGLQAVTTNMPAQSLYAALGYTAAGTYHYRYLQK